MTILAMASVKGAPGVTTTACLVAAAWPEDRKVLLVEDDTCGGDLAARFSLSARRGWSSFAAASRRLEGVEPLDAHVQLLPGGQEVLVGSSRTDLGEHSNSVRSLLASAASDEEGKEGRRDVVADLGRLVPGERASDVWLERSTVVVLVLHRDAASIFHARNRATSLRSQCANRVGMVLMGAGKFSNEEIMEFTGLPLLGVLPHDPSAARLVSGSPGGTSRLSRSTLVLTARRLATRLSGEDPVRLMGEPVGAVDR